MQYLKNVLWTLGILAVIFFVLDFFNVTSYLLFPYSCVTGKNKTLTTSLGDTPAVGGNA